MHHTALELARGSMGQNHVGDLRTHSEGNQLREGKKLKKKNKNKTEQVTEILHMMVQTLTNIILEAHIQYRNYA